MIICTLIAGIISFIAFLLGAFKFWKKEQPFYYQILICAAGCYALYQIIVCVMTFCKVNETTFNNSFFGLLATNLLLLCSNFEILEKKNQSNKTVAFLSAFGATLTLGFIIIVGIFYCGITNFAFYMYLIAMLPMCLVVYIVLTRLLIKNENKICKETKLTSLLTIVFCELCIADIACWINVSIISGIADLINSLVLLALIISAFIEAKKWNF